MKPTALIDQVHASCEPTRWVALLGVTLLACPAVLFSGDHLSFCATNSLTKGLSMITVAPARSDSQLCHLSYVRQQGKAKNGTAGQASSATRP
jgi:hypothetical protein